MSVKILHFSDAHIDMVQGGRRDPASGFSIRTLDFLKALDTIVDTAIEKKVDLVLFAGDAYRDPTPVPTYQREWGKRMMRLSDAGIPTLMIAGNHDSTPAGGKASALQEYDTLRIPYLNLARSIKIWSPEELNQVPVQVLTIPWISRSRMVARDQTFKDVAADGEDPVLNLQNTIADEAERMIAEADPSLPLILMTHYSVVGAEFSSNQMVSLGKEVTLPLSLVRNPRLAYTALGHIHKYQNLNNGKQPPVIYPGSIERVNFGESNETKGFILAEISRDAASYQFVALETRPMYNLKVKIDSAENFQQQVMDALPPEDKIQDAMIALEIIYPEEWLYAFNERELRRLMAPAFDFRLFKNPQVKSRLRLSVDVGISGMSHQELLNTYLTSKNMNAEEIHALAETAQSIFGAVEGFNPEEMDPA